MQPNNEAQVPDAPPASLAPANHEIESTDGPIMRKIKTIIKPAYVKVLNIIACCILTLGATLRTIYCFTVKIDVEVAEGEEAKTKTGFNLWFFITTLYFFVFIFITAAIEAHETNKFSVFCRTYFNFLDKVFGRGVFLLFLSMMLLERKQGNGEVAMCVIVAIIAGLNMILGFGDAKKKMASLPWEKSAAEPAGAPAQTGPKQGGNGLQYDANTDTYKVNLDGAQTRAAAVQGVKEGLGMQGQNDNIDPYAPAPSNKYPELAPTRPSSVPLSQPVESSRNQNAPDIEQQQPQAYHNDNNSKPIDEKSIELEDPYAQN